MSFLFLFAVQKSKGDVGWGGDFGSTDERNSWVYPTEVFPLATRSRGTALSTLAFSLAGGAINEIIPYLIDAISFWVFILFALINLAMLIPIYLFYVGKSLQDRKIKLRCVESLVGAMVG